MKCFGEVQKYDVYIINIIYTMSCLSEEWNQIS